MYFIYLTYLLTFYTTSGLCFLFDYFNKNDIRRNDKMIQYKNINNNVLQNSFIYIPIVAIPFEYIFHPISYNEQFNLFQDLLRIVFGLLSLDLFFYTCHRIMHIPMLYKWSHKLHHTYKESVGMEALYLHWFDLYIGNILPLYLPIVGAHLYTLILWTVFIISFTVFTHSGIRHNTHDDHHRYFNYNFGVHVYMDKLLKTDYK